MSKDVCMHVQMCAICGRKTREERTARGLLGRVAKEEKIRDPYAEGADNRQGAERRKEQRIATGNILKVDKVGRRKRKREKDETPGEG